MMKKTSIQSEKLRKKTIRGIDSITATYHDNIIREIEDTMSCSVMNTTDKIKIIDYTLSLCPTLNLTRIFNNVKNYRILNHIHKIDTKKTINYNDVFDSATDDVIFILPAVFAIQHGATNWYGCDDNEHIDGFIKGGAGRILDEYPEYRNNDSAEAYTKLRKAISRLLVKVKLIPVIVILTMEYLPYEIPELTDAEMDDLKSEFDFY